MNQMHMISKRHIVVALTLHPALSLLPNKPICQRNPASALVFACASLMMTRKCHAQLLSVTFFSAHLYRLNSLTATGVMQKQVHQPNTNAVQRSKENKQSATSSLNTAIIIRSIHNVALIMQSPIDHTQPVNTTTGKRTL
ncbi:hypothetical protein XELAEV_18031092mg [Xenopus laevis]|uniref:Secreted protein n=1 Tax=Xenopus laevis TaxID=8355 RepID=A0A974HFC9_XENLA|nr:hypothetical protein XELAEV_18031092mg [Xenopus laevis]